MRGARINTVYRIVHQYSPDSRLLLSLLAFVCSLYLAYNVSPLAGLFAVVGVWLIWDALRHSSIWDGFRAFRRGDLSEVRFSLSQVRWPHLLNAESLAYYHWLRGVVEMADARFAAAKVHLLVAASGRLHTENDRALVHCLLAEIGLQENEITVAQEHLHHARALQHHPDVDRIIRNLSARLEK